MYKPDTYTVEENTAEHNISEPHFKPRLNLLDATMIVAGSMIGSGIFIVSADMVKDVGSAGWLIFAWVLTALMTIAAALSYGELSAMFPRAGGMYVYLKEAYGSLMGFLYGWSFFTVIQTGMIAAIGVSFSKFAAYLFPVLSEKNVLFDLGFLQISAAQLLGIATIVILTYINTKGIEAGKTVQNVLTITKLATLLGITVLGLLLASDSEIWNANWQHPFTLMQHSLRMANGGGSDSWHRLTGIATLGALAAAMTGSILTSDSWYNITFIAGEVKNPKRNIGLSLFLGTSITTFLYVLCNIMYLAVLPIGNSSNQTESLAFAADNRVGVAAALAIFGNAGTYIIAVLIMISNFGCNNGMILSGARVYYTMAQDGLFFEKTGHLNKAAVPAYGLWLQCVIASLLCLSGKYGDLLDYISFVVMLFYVFTIAGIIVLRIKRPELLRPYKAFGYPVVTVIYILLAAAFCIFLIIARPAFTSRGLVIVLIGIPVYYYIVANKKMAKGDRSLQA